MRKAKARTLVIILDATLSECFASLPENKQVDEQYTTNNWHDFPEKKRRQFHHKTKILFIYLHI